MNTEPFSWYEEIFCPIRKTVEIGISYINRGYRMRHTRRCCNIQFLCIFLCFDLLIKDNDVEIAELIISIWSLSVKSNNILQPKNFIVLGQIVRINSLN